MTRRRDKRIWFVALGVFVTVFLFTFLAGRFEASEEKVEAASLANFDPGYIISDYQMGNFNSMTEAEIQAFLTKKNPCSNTDYNYYLQLSANKNYKWHFKDGHFVCLSEELFGDGETIGEGETAAHIIWQAAQDYRINPQVLIVLIQKESSLITDPIPNNKNYRAATGYGCPDTAPCSTEYYGFKNQVRKAAALFRSVLDGGWTNYPVGNNYIQYNPNASCGGSIVNIKSLATSALYRYTPYQPNAGAIAAGYGSATCGAYGNRNFYLYFEDWFGGIRVEGDTRTEIEKYYDSLGGEKSYLGKALGKETCGLLDNGCYREYEKGNIYWKRDAGAWDVSGEMLQAYTLQGSEWGKKLGYPIDKNEKNEEGISQQSFENGKIYLIEEKTYIVRDFAERFWTVDLLGKEKTYGSCDLRDDGCFQIFEKGAVYYSAQNGSHVVLDDIYKRWSGLGSESKSGLGYPTIDTTCGLAKKGCYQAFENGNIYWTEATGAWEVSGNMLVAYSQNGAEWSGKLGYPTNSEQKDANGATYQSFENGNIYIKNGKVWVIQEFAAKRWTELGGMNSKLGKILNSGVCGLAKKGCYQAFENGNIYWTEATGAWEVSGNMLVAYSQNGAEWSGKLGYPTNSEQKDANGATYQSFENGNIYIKNGKAEIVFRND